MVLNLAANLYEVIAQLYHWPYVKVPCLGISKGHEIVALESKRAQASASSMITLAMVSVLIICANGSAFSSQGGTASCFFLAGRSMGEGFGLFIGKGETQASCTRIPSLPPTSISFALLNLRAVALNESPSSLLIWTGLSLWGPAGSCLSLQVLRRCLKI